VFGSDTNVTVANLARFAQLHHGIETVAQDSDVVAHPRDALVNALVYQ